MTIRYLLTLVFFCSQFFLWGQSDLVPYRKGKKWGFKSYTTQEVVIKPKYKNVRPYSHNRAVFQKGKKFGYLDEHGKEVIKAKYSQASDFGCYDLARVKLKNKYHAITLNGTEPNFRIFDCDQGQAIKFGKVFSLNGKQGFATVFAPQDTLLKPQYDEIIPIPTYQYIDSVSFMVRRGPYWGIVQRYDKPLVQCEYDSVFTAPDAMCYFAILVKDGKAGAYSLKTGTIIPCIYTSIVPYASFVAAELSPEVWGYIDDESRKYWE